MVRIHRRYEAHRECPISTDTREGWACIYKAQDFCKGEIQMNNLLCRFREFKEKCRRNLIHKLGGFSILPPAEKPIIVRSTTVAPTKFTCKALFSQQVLYDITPADLEKVAKDRLRSKLIAQITESNMVDFTTMQDKNTGAIEMQATIWVVEPRSTRETEG